MAGHAPRTMLMATRAPYLNPKIDEERVYAVRAVDETDSFEGHASAWWSVDSYGTAMKPGAFTRTLKARGDRISLLWQHDPYTPIGRPTSFKQDDHGLAFKASVVTETRAGAEAMALLRAETPLGMSFGFQTQKSRAFAELDDAEKAKLDWSQAPDFYKSKEGKDLVRLIEEVRLWEISLVTFPANEAATITAVRAERDLAQDTTTFSSFMNAIKDGSLDEERTALVAQLVDAWQSRPGPGGIHSDHSTPDEAARRDRDRQIELALITAKWGQFLGVQHGY